MERDVRLLPKAHLHLHFTGSMRPTTLLELADKYGVHLPDALTGGEPPKLRATDERGWFRFQRLYDIARSCLRSPEDIHRLVRESAQEDVADGSGWLEIQVDPTSYAPLLGGLIPAIEIILDAVDSAARDTGLGMRVVIAANRMKHPLDARTLARLAVRYADRGVVGFGLSNDERRGMARDFDRAFAIAREGVCWRPRTVGSSRAPPACATAWTTWTPRASATGSGPPRTPGCWHSWPSAR